MKTKTFLFIIIIFFSTKVFCDEISNQSVITEEYVAKVIIEGKWGTNAGEFGVQSGGTSIGEYDEVYAPNSLAVNTKGEIYILDLINNRIQKFDKKGKYLLSIPVDSWKGEFTSEAGIPVDQNNPEGDVRWVRLIHPCESRGINIAIDSEDNIYYYCVKGYRNYEWTKGEVWLFKNDKLVRKWETNVMERFEPPPDYEIEKQKLDKDREKVIIKFKDGKKMEKEVKAFRKLKDTDILSTYSPKILKKRNEIIISNPRIFNNETKKWEGEHITYVYDFNGNLKSIIKGHTPIYNDGNNYGIETEQNGIQIIKYERIPKRK